MACSYQNCFSQLAAFRCKAQLQQPCLHAVLLSQEIDNPIMHGRLNYAQLTLACALGLEAWNPLFAWRASHPQLAHWLAPFANRPSFAATVAPGPLALA